MYIWRHQSVCWLIWRYVHRKFRFETSLLFSMFKTLVSACFFVQKCTNLIYTSFTDSLFLMCQIYLKFTINNRMTVFFGAFDLKFCIQNVFRRSTFFYFVYAFHSCMTLPCAKVVFDWFSFFLQKHQNKSSSKLESKIARPHLWTATFWNIPIFSEFWAS